MNQIVPGFKKNFGYYLILGLLGCICIMVLVSLFRPMAGLNEWRDGQTFGVARNMVEEGIDLLRPRFDLRGQGPGILPSEFPFYNAFAAVLMKLFWVDFFWARLASLFFFIGMIWINFRWLQQYGSKKIAWASIPLTLFNTVLVVQSTAIMPEATCVGLMATAWYFGTKKKIRYDLAIFFAVLSSLVKPSGAAVAPALAFMWLVGDRRNLKTILLAMMVILFPVASVFLWKNWVMQFAHNIYDGEPVTHAYNRTARIILHDINFEMLYHAIKKSLLHGAGITFLLLSPLLAWKIWKKEPVVESKFRHLVIGLIIWILASGLFLVMAGHFQSHQTYYATPIAVPFVLLISILLFRIPYHIIISALILQAIGTIYYFQRDVFSNFDLWSEKRAVFNQASEVISRDKRVLSMGPPGAFPALSRIGARGIIIGDMNWLEKEINLYDYLYLQGAYLVNRQKFENRYGKPIELLDGSLIFRIKR